MYHTVGPVNCIMLHKIQLIIELKLYTRILLYITCHSHVYLTCHGSTIHFELIGSVKSGKYT